MVIIRDANEKHMPRPLHLGFCVWINRGEVRFDSVIFVSWFIFRLDGRAVCLKTLQRSYIPIALQFLLSGIEERSIALFQKSASGVARETVVDVRRLKRHQRCPDRSLAKPSASITPHERATRFVLAKLDDNHPRAAGHRK